MAEQVVATDSNSSTTRDQRLAQRAAELSANDAQFRRALPLATVIAAKTRPGLRLPQIVASVMEGYADRPAVGERVRELLVDPGTGRKTLRLTPAFQTITYRELWSRVSSLATIWHHDKNLRVDVGDFVCILAFAGIDYVVVDLAAIYTGAVTVPLQSNAATAQLVEMVTEIEPRCFAASVACLHTAVDIILANAPSVTARLACLIVFDYQSEDDAQREIVEAARQRLAAAGHPKLLHTLEALCAQGAALPPAPLYAPQTGEEPLSTIYYTSGSTGSPKGAMYPERMVKIPWLGVFATPRICLHYMPMNHSYGRIILFTMLGNGGTCYFTAKNDLSTLFEDIRLIRPTQLTLVPRICEMIFHAFQGEMERLRPIHSDPAALEQAAIGRMREDYLGGRILECNFGAAPLTSELKAFIESCLDVNLNNGYGTTETAGISFNNRILRPPIIDYKLVDMPDLGYFNTDKPYPRGELRVKTSNLMRGYFKRPDLTEAMLDENGYYKTGDIMAEIGPDQIVYLDRCNNVLKLAQGEFVAIARLEAIFSSGHPLIRQCYLYGSSERAFLLAVIVPDNALLAASGLLGDEAAIKAALRDALKNIATTQQLHSYEVPRDFIIETEAFSVENGLLAGVGKYLRPALKVRYGERLNQLYADMAASQTNVLSALRQDGGNQPVAETLARAVGAILGIENVDLGRAHRFADLGGDSLSALSFSLLLEEIFGLPVPVGIITNPASNLSLLASHIEKARADARQGISPRPNAGAVHGPDASEIHARDLTLEKFIDAATLQNAKTLSAVNVVANTIAKTVLLTGANGYLGRFLCLEWLERLAPLGGKLICITRGEDAAAARQRIVDGFDSGDANLLQHFNQLANEHLEVLSGDIGEMKLGLTEADWQRLAATVDLIVHPAALVNHVLPYAQLFGPNVVGTAELIRLALTTRLKPFINVSTVAAAYRDDGSAVAEDADVRVAAPSRSNISTRYASGYANSKWAGEVLLRDAHERFALPVTVFRSDMILAHSTYLGQINVPDMFTRWLYSVVVTGLAPRSFYLGAPALSTVRAHYDGLPVDFTAAAIATLGLNTSGYRTYHVLNPHDDGISLDQFVDWIIAAGYPVRRIEDYDDWLSRFETALRALPDKQRQHSSLSLIHQLRRPASPVAGSQVSATQFHAGVRTHMLDSYPDIPHLSQAFIGKYLDDLRHLGLISQTRYA